MIIDSKRTFEQLQKDRVFRTDQKQPKRVLMCSPDHFRVEYAINPFMKAADGQLNVVNERLAHAQWQALHDIYDKLGFNVEILAGAVGYPDMVFAANQSFPFLDKNQESNVILSNMRSIFRKGEVTYFREWYKQNHYKVHEVATGNTFFEGNGDALIQYPYNIVWGGYGHRTSREAYDEIVNKFNFHVVPLHLDVDRHYHLDLCMSILRHDTVVIYPQAFSSESLEIIRMGFERVIEVDGEENLKYACCNCHSPDGKHVITHSGATKFVSALKSLGFEVIEVDTSEFLKSGGSVFCMKMMVF